jgi:hypothetical protein
MAEKRLELKQYLSFACESRDLEHQSDCEFVLLKCFVQGCWGSPFNANK